VAKVSLCIINGRGGATHFDFDNDNDDNDNDNDLILRLITVWDGGRPPLFKMEKLCGHTFRQFKPNFPVKTFLKGRYFRLEKSWILPNPFKLTKFLRFLRKIRKLNPWYLGKWENIRANFCSPLPPKKTGLPLTTTLLSLLTLSLT